MKIEKKREKELISLLKSCSVIESVISKCRPVCKVAIWFSNKTALVIMKVSKKQGHKVGKCLKLVKIDIFEFKGKSMIEINWFVGWKL